LLGRRHPMNVDTAISAAARKAATSSCMSKGRYACRPEGVMVEEV
jgi:hypothetical protein